MKIVFIMLVHKNPLQIIRLVNRLNTDGVSFLIHADKSSGPKFYDELAESVGCLENVYFVKDRISCTWGHFNIVEATNQAIKELLELPLKFDYAVLISGQDYPIKPISKFIEFLESYKSMNFLENFMLPCEKWRYGGYYRINTYITTIFNNKYDFIFSMLFFALFRRKRKFLFGLYPDFYPYGGSQWWCLTRESLEYINDFSEKNKRFNDFFRHTIFPDEMYYQTILMNSHLESKCVSDNLKYSEWPRPKSANPAILTKKHYDNIISSKCFFARKFDSNADSGILDMLDSYLDNY